MANYVVKDSFKKAIANDKSWLLLSIYGNNYTEFRIKVSGSNDCKECRSFVKARYVQLLFNTLLNSILFSSRYILSIAIVAMTTPNTSSNAQVPVYKWTNNSIILSSFFWSYAIIQFFACWISHSYGPKWYLTAAMLVDSVTNLVIPVVSDTIGPNGLIACRVLQGFAQGMAIPLLTELLGRWAPPSERTWMNSVTLLGIFASIMISKFTAGFIAASWMGWPPIFYILGSMGFFITLLWIAFGHNKPADHPRITIKERQFIESALGQENRLVVDSIPWTAIFSSLPFWAIVISAVGESWLSTLIATELPTYFAEVLKLDITSNGVLSTISFGAGAATSLVSGPMIDYIINRGYVTRTNARKIFNGLALFGPAITIIIVPYVSNYYATVASLFAITYASKTLIQHMVNMLDISPMYSGILMGLSNGIGQFVAIFAPIAVQYIVYDKSDVSLWSIVFFLSSGIFTVSGIFYTIFMSGERQWWDSSD